MLGCDEEAAGAAVALLLRIVAQRLEPGQLVHGHVDLHDRAFHLDRLDCLAVVGRNVAFVDEREPGALGIGVGEDDVCLDFLATRQGDTGCAAVLHDNLLDIRSKPNLDASLFGDAGKRLRDRAHRALSHTSSARDGQ